MEVTYTLENAALTIDYRAVSDKTTVVNLTNHTYFNLAGHDSGPVDGQILTLAADRYTPAGRATSPPGRLPPWRGPPGPALPARLGDRLDHPFLAGTRGFDHNFVLRNPATGPAAVLSSPETGVALELETTLPGVQVYTAGFLGERRGKVVPFTVPAMPYAWKPSIFQMQSTNRAFHRRSCGRERPTASAPSTVFAPSHKSRLGFSAKPLFLLEILPSRWYYRRKEGGRAMKISTKGRYALRLMLDLALSNDGQPVSLRDVAKRQGISDKYLEQIVTSLSRAGLVRSVEGGRGLPADPGPGQLYGGEILRPLEEPGAGELCGRQRLLRPGGPLRHRGRLAADPGSGVLRGGPHHPARPGGAVSPKDPGPSQSVTVYGPGHLDAGPIFDTEFQKRP